MKKIIIWTSIWVLSLSVLHFASADNHLEKSMNNMNQTMMNMNQTMTKNEYGMFTNMVRSNLTDLEKIDLKELLKQRKSWMEKIKLTIWKVNSWELNNFEEFAKIAPKRKAMIEKLKFFMKDENAFEYMCMNHWDDLIAKLFADEKMVLKFKNIFARKYKSKIESIYLKQWKKFEKSIHKLYHKSIDSKKIKDISIIRALELIVEDIKKWDM